MGTGLILIAFVLGPLFAEGSHFVYSVGACLSLQMYGIMLRALQQQLQARSL